MSFIYRIVNLVNGKCYIGKTDGTIEHRFKAHIQDMNATANINRPLYKAFKKYGIENFVVEQVEECSQKEAPNREKYWIEFFNSYAGNKNSNGYNVTLGGDGVSKYDDELIWKKYLELNNIQQTANYFGCDRRMVRRVINSKGIIHSAAKVKKIYQLDRETFEKIDEFDSMKDAARKVLQPDKTLEGVRNSIKMACKNNACTSLGYRWCYAEDYKKVLQKKGKIKNSIAKNKQVKSEKVSRAKRISKEEEDKIIELCLKGNNVKQIAKQVQRHEETVSNVLKRRGFGDKISHNRKYNYVEIYNTYLKCGTKKETAEKIGCSINTVTRAIQNNLTSR